MAGPRSKHTGIEIRHSKTCPVARATGRSSCTPTYRAEAFSARDSDPLVLRDDPSRQLLDLRLKAFVLRRQHEQHLDNSVAALFVDRLGLTTLHTTRFDNPALCPPTQLNAYGFWFLGGGSLPSRRP